jgi:ribose 5-phosphate isomerase B
MSLKIAIGGDHAGYSYKKDLIVFLQSKGYEVKDFGTFSESSVD